MARKPRERKYKRLFLAADLHGSEITFRKFLGAATFYDADALLIGGDLTAKSITPIVQQRDGRYQTRLAGGARADMSLIPCQSRVLAIVIPAVRSRPNRWNRKSTFASRGGGLRCLDKNNPNVK